MASINEVSIGIGKESTYGTPVTVTRWVEFLADTDTLTYAPVRVDGEGLRYGGKVKRANRHVTVGVDASGGFGVELFSKGLGLLFESALGSGASTLVSGTGYQQNFTLGGATPSPLTIQKGVVGSDGTTYPQTYTSAICKTVNIEANTDAIARATFDFDIRDMTTATAYTSPSYASGGSLFHFAQGAITIGGTVTPPTTNTLASGGTSVTNVNAFTMTVDNGLSTPARKLSDAGLKSRPIVGMRTISGTVDVEYSDNVLRDAIINDTELGMVLTFTSTEEVDTGVYAAFSIYLPSVRFNGDMPTATGSLPTMSLNWEAYDDETNEPAMISIRTTDSAL